jgi:hypothetical protein
VSNVYLESVDDEYSISNDYEHNSENEDLGKESEIDELNESNHEFTNEEFKEFFLKTFLKYKYLNLIPSYVCDEILNDIHYFVKMNTNNILENCISGEDLKRLNGNHNLINYYIPNLKLRLSYEKFIEKLGKIYSFSNSSQLIINRNSDNKWPISFKFPLDKLSSSLLNRLRDLNHIPTKSENIAIVTCVFQEMVQYG